jgi:LPXTG-motif cell wall-anchored protein
VSRGGAKRASEPTGGTPIWVWVVYALGLLAAAIFAFSILFTFGAYLLSDDVGVTFDVSVLGIVVWGALLAIAGGLLLWRRRRR